MKWGLEQMIKRFFDIIVSVFILIILHPLYIFILFQVKKNLGSPIFFRQIRPGRNGIPFNMIKFRTMKDSVDKDGNILPDSERLTDFGKKLRASSLDELPELWNVLKGEMSLVGPRPLLMEYLPLYNEEQRRRHDVRPGITGWAQVNGRNAISWEDKFKLDIWYVDNRSFLLDIKILFKTLVVIFSRKDINFKDDVTTNMFTGSDNKDS